jgi:hypothetical protein
VKARFWIAIFCSLPRVLWAAGNYPVDGQLSRPAKDARAACAAVREFGVQNLSGKIVGEVVVFAGSTRLDFGGSAGTESTNVLAERLPDGWFKIVDQYTDDGKGDSRPASKRKSYVLKILSPTALELRDGPHVARYTKCILDQAEQDKLVPPLPAAALTERWYDADSRCRGGSGTHRPPTQHVTSEGATPGASTRSANATASTINLDPT